jgi:hypothetical protein
MGKIDFKRELKHLYSPSAKDVQIVEVPEMNFLMIDGAGDPNTAQEFKDGVEVLYALSYTLKFMVKKGERQIDYSVLPLEGLWWADDMSQFNLGKKDIWKWTVMIMQPEYVTRGLFQEAMEQVQRKKNPPGLSKARFQSWCEGLSVQIIYIGPYSAEGPTIEKLHRFIKENGYELTGKHHEIYLGDPRKSAPEKLRTVIRQPVRRI